MPRDNVFTGQELSKITRREIEFSICYMHGSPLPVLSMSCLNTSQDVASPRYSGNHPIPERIVSMRPLIIHDLILQKCKELSISQQELIVRSGITNTAKGLRRLQQLFDGDFIGSRGLIERLPNALNLPPSVVEDAINTSKQQIADEVEAAWRSNFVPHALVITANNGRPRQITIAAICNAGRNVRIDFPESLAATDFKEYAFKVLITRIPEIAKFFYELQGILINYSPDKSVKFSLDKNIVEESTRAIKGGQLSFTIR